MYPEFGLLIDGQWITGGDRLVSPVIDPCNEDIVGEVPQATVEDIGRVLRTLTRAGKSWRKVPAWDRSVLLRRIADEIRKVVDEASYLMSLETGKPLAEAVGEMNAVVDQFEWYADEARRIFGHSLDGREEGVSLQVRYEPIGPVAAFTAWNFPALLPARKIAAALAAGCPLVIKPSEEAPSATFMIAKAAQAAGLPDGVLNVVTGNSAAISRQLIASPIIRKVSLTGSVPVGKLLLAQCAETVKKVSMELGGHAPVLVFPDADPVATGKACARTKFRNAGQVCISPTRFYVHESIYQPFIDSMVAETECLRVGPGIESGVDCGPMVNKRGRNRVIELVQDALEQGAELLTGGRIPTDLPHGFFYAPTILGRVSDQARIMREEPFGPVAPISTFRDFDEVITRANSLPFGLAGYVFSKSLQTANRAANALEVGMVGVNDLLLAAAEAPFGGVKESGMGREGGQLGIFDYLDPKYIKLRFS